MFSSCRDLNKCVAPSASRGGPGRGWGSATHRYSTAFADDSPMNLRRSLDRRLRAFFRVALSDYVAMGLSAGLGLLVVSTIVHTLFGSFAGAAASVGAIAVIPTDQLAPRHRKFWQLFPAAVISLPLFFGVQIVRDDPLWLGLLVVPAAFVAFLGAAWGKRGVPISISAMLAVVFSMAVQEGGDLDTPLRVSAYFALGSALYLVYATLANIALNPRYRVASLADTLLAVARLMRSQARQFKPAGRVATDDPLGDLMRAQAALADQLQSARDLLLESPSTPRRQRLAGMLVQVLDMRDHLLACQLDLELVVAQPGQDEVLAALRETLVALAAEIERIADALLIGRRPRPFESHRPRLARIAAASDARGAADASDGAQSAAIVSRGLASRIGYLDDEALRLVAVARGDREPDLAVVRTAWRMFVSPTRWSLRPFLSLWRWDAPPLRHAIRAALAIATGYLVTVILPWGSHPYWVLLTIVVVLRGSLAQTLERRNARVIGTLIGGLLAQALLVNAPPEWLLLLVVPFAQGIAHAFGIRRYVITAVAATVLALVQAHLLQADTSLTIEAFERIGDTLLGTGIAWAFSYVLPSWERQQIPALVARVVAAHARHARLALALGPRLPDDAVPDAEAQPELAWRLARREVYDALSALVQATTRSLAEPRAVRPPLESLGPLLARSYTLLAQLTAVKTMLLLRRDRLDAEAVAAPLRQSADAIAATLEAGRAPDHDPDALHAALAPRDLTQLGDPFAQDLTPWLLRRLSLARELARQVHADAARIRQRAR